MLDDMAPAPISLVLGWEVGPKRTKIALWSVRFVS